MQTGYGRGEIEPRIAPLVEAIQRAGFVTFSSCEGHTGDEDAPTPRLGSVGFYASESKARLVHRHWLHYRGKLRCSWMLHAGFVARRGADDWALGWTLENGGLKEGASAPFVKSTVEAAWNVDIPILIDMFDELARENS